MKHDLHPRIALVESIGDFRGDLLNGTLVHVVARNRAYMRGSCKSADQLKQWQFGALCRQQQIFVARPFPPLSTCMRLTIGTMAEMEEAVPAMLALLEAKATAARFEAEPAWSPGGAC